MHILFTFPVLKNLVKPGIPVALFLFISSPAFTQTDSSAIFLQKGLVEKQNGRRLESLRQFEKAAKYNANNKAVLTELASAYNDLRKHAQAIETYKKLVEIGEGNAEIYKQLLLLSFYYRQQADVVTYAEKLQQADPSEKVSYYVAKVYYEQGNYGKALQHLETAAKEDPQNGEIAYLAGHSYMDMNNYKMAIPYFQKAIQLDTTKPLWLYELGLTYYGASDNKNALKYIKAAGDKGINKDDVYMDNLSTAYIMVGQFDQGIAIMKEMLEKRPADLTLLNSIAEAYYDNGKYQDAIDYWDKILGYDKTKASALYMIGLSFQKKGEKEKGQRLCDKAIEMDPSLNSLRQKRMTEGL